MTFQEVKCWWYGHNWNVIEPNGKGIPPQIGMFCSKCGKQQLWLTYFHGSNDHEGYPPCV